MDHAASSTYPTYLSETIHFQAPANTLDPKEIATLYIEKHLSTSQVAQQLGCSRTFVITTLKRMGLIRHKRKAQTHPTNYRNPVPPFGYRVVDGKLTTHTAELKTCRLIVELIDRQGFNFTKTARYLTQEGIKNRRSKISWHNYTVNRIYLRWKGKL